MSRDRVSYAQEGQIPRDLTGTHQDQMDSGSANPEKMTEITLVFKIEINRTLSILPNKIQGISN